MTEFHKIWIEQCEAAGGIRERFGIEKALGYLIGEKLLNFVRASDTRAEFAAELPDFVAEIRRTFDSYEIHDYLENIHRAGALGHVATDEDVEYLREADVFQEDPVQGAEDVILVERIKEMLLA